ncbi:unnamed protein product, partial [Sphacelaria rigidula]
GWYPKSLVVSARAVSVAARVTRFADIIREVRVRGIAGVGDEFGAREAVFYLVKQFGLGVDLLPVRCAWRQGTYSPAPTATIIPAITTWQRDGWKGLQPRPNPQRQRQQQ